MPQGVSVIGFDDSSDAFDNDLTSYNFSVPSLVHAMVRYVLDSRASSSEFYRQEPIELDGFINRRGTTGATPRTRPGLGG